jgi:hypothetical protein
MLVSSPPVGHRVHAIVRLRLSLNAHIFNVQYEQHSTEEDFIMESLKAGRQLDALITEKILGEKYEFLEFVGDCCHPGPEDSVAYDCCPRYSTDIAAAWQVVEKLIATTPQQDLHIKHWYHEEDESSGWQVSSCCEFGEWEDWVQAKTLPLAICLAALQASGV